MRKILYIVLFILVLSSICEARADIKLPAVLSDNMVLQQQTSVKIWGKADPSEKVMVKSSWDKKNYTTQADINGIWMVEIKTPKASSNQSLIVQGNNTIQINNVLIGEVWLCSGQSNMDFPIAKSKGWRTGVINEEEEMKDADYPEIRLFHVTQKLSPEQELDDCEGQWMVCNAENLKDFSAVAFFFGRDLYKNLKTPVGLIQSTWGGTHAESWTKMSVMQNDPIYAELLKDYYDKKKSYPADLKKYEEDSARYEAEKAKGNKDIKAPKKPSGIYHNKALATLWNGMIHPLIPYTIKGVIWYQGESNSVRHQDYTHVFTKMIKSWRTEWKQGDFPFYFVQIAPHYKQPPQIREAQLKTWQTVKNTGMAVITDAGDSTDIHPRYKQIPAERLVRWALAKNYGKKVAYSGPVFKSIKVKGNEAILSFSYTYNGLTAKDGKLSGFVVAWEDRKFYPATATISNDKLIVYSPDVSNPVSVRYGWDKFFRVNLYNSDGLPATPFRTDNRKE